MTRLVCSIHASSAAQLEDDVGRARRGGADAVEVRIDGLGGDPSWIAAVLAQHPEIEFVVTCRPRAEGGLSDDPPAVRLERMRRAAGDNHVCFDFEWADWAKVAGDSAALGIRGSAGSPARAEARGSGEGRPPEKRSPEVTPTAAASDRPGSPRLILSSHRFDGITPDAMGWAGAVHEAHGDVVAKIVWQPHDLCDNIGAAAAMHAGRGRTSAICLGEDGIISRVLAPKWGAHASYCALDDSRRTAPGQLALEQMVRRYRFKSITPDTRVYGVIGDPVAHSMGPVLFNALFEHHQIDAVYLPWRVPAGMLREFLDRFQPDGPFNLGGFSVTLPHKVAACDCVGGVGNRLTGAVNTITAVDGRWRGRNTDTWAASAALSTVLGADELRNARIDLLGAGGTGRALANWFQSVCGQITLFGRDPARCEAIAAGGCTVKRWEERTRSGADVLINATPVGMWPRVDDSPMPIEALGRYAVVFDVIYNPVETRLLREAKTAGCRTLSGLEMFLLQAAFQFACWTGVHADVERVRPIVLAELERQRTGEDAAE
ncbi:MAG: type I 3-dehydroquinate dehydratase [Phycisphaerales bacterium]|nr:MAG: type I 3-dehydroquinate dehydratase [Phycisphaerales bacterium]